eukprot:TRINITY_DN7469_c0_g1_i1.p1 TRINITY_DN7469_c0_g1~~TRINITY_DN7469_c0_g1_i1.p1  ORF type:complete len:243 (+),score=94.65 TRINITY_DN7469_c0_g1_i1:87-815(+)
MCIRDRYQRRVHGESHLSGKSGEENMESQPIVLGYWNVQGRIEPIRQLCEYIKFPYTNKIYEDAATWAADKAKLNTPFPNIPYLIDGEKVITETGAMKQYILQKANRLDILGRTDEERVEERLLTGYIDDTARDIIFLLHTPTWEAAKEKVINEKTIPRLKKLDDRLAGRKHLTGDNVTLIDFGSYTIFQILKKLDPTAISRHANLTNVINNYENIPELKAYFASERFLGGNIMPPSSVAKI